MAECLLIRRKHGVSELCNLMISTNPSPEFPSSTLSISLSETATTLVTLSLPEPTTVISTSNTTATFSFVSPVQPQTTMTASIPPSPIQIGTTASTLSGTMPSLSTSTSSLSPTHIANPLTSNPHFPLMFILPVIGGSFLIITFVIIFVIWWLGKRKQEEQRVDQIVENAHWISNTKQGLKFRRSLPWSRALGFWKGNAEKAPAGWV